VNNYAPRGYFLESGHGWGTKSLGVDNTAQPDIHKWANRATADRASPFASQHARLEIINKENNQLFWIFKLLGNPDRPIDTQQIDEMRDGSY
jgi:hypothetical protein